MTTTYTNMIDEALLNLSGYTMRQDRTTHLTQEISASALTLNLADVSNIGKGVVEIDDELLWIDSYDRVSNTATVAPYGRGYNGTTAAVHTVNSRVTVAPTFPKAVVKKAINDTIDAVFPQLFAVGVHVFNFNTAKTTYSLPAEAETILYVSWQPTGPSEEWMPLRKWRQDSLANTTAFASGNSISVYDNVEAGRKIQVFYTKKPATLSASAGSAVQADSTIHLQKQITQIQRSSMALVLQQHDSCLDSISNALTKKQENFVMFTQPESTIRGTNQ